MTTVAAEAALLAQIENSKSLYPERTRRIAADAAPPDLDLVNVYEIDIGAGKVTLKHGPAPSLGMDEGMTMVYRVKDPALLKQVKVGDKVTFEAEHTDAGYAVTKLQKSK